MPTFSFVVFFNQILGAALTQKLVKILFSSVSTFFVHFDKIHNTRSRVDEEGWVWVNKA